MVAKNRIIIDTDPGGDDVLALLLALSASPQDLEVLMISLTYGNIGLDHTLRNAITMFHVIDKEIRWRKSNSVPEGFSCLKACKPIIAVGADHPLEEDELMSDYFHGMDGLHGVHERYPHLTPAETWKTLFTNDSEEMERMPFCSQFTPSKEPSHKEILRILRENEADTISVIAIGPMTNIALAAAEDPQTLLRAKELIVMGGAINMVGNITPVAEFNTYADAIASARVFALTSPQPHFTMPPKASNGISLPDYPTNLRRRLKLTLFPMDITTQHCLDWSLYKSRTNGLIQKGSPLAQWVSHFLTRSFEQMGGEEGSEASVNYALHDPLTIWYLLTREQEGWVSTTHLEDIRIETAGQWTRGMHVVDRRNLKQPMGSGILDGVQSTGYKQVVDVSADIVDYGHWLSNEKGNRIKRMISSPSSDEFQEALVKMIFSLD